MPEKTAFDPVPQIRLLADEWRDWEGKAGIIKTHCQLGHGPGRIKAVGDHLVEIERYDDAFKRMDSIVTHVCMIEYFLWDEIMTQRLKLIDTFPKCQ